MVCEKIDLYAYFGEERKGREGGFLTVYARERNPELPRKIRPAMLVVPGGAYYSVSAREGEPVALSFVGEGYQAFVLEYTTKTAHPVPLFEAAMAMRFIRTEAEKYSVDPTHVGAIGFSAGGHLIGLLATVWEQSELCGVRPDAVALAYPVVTTGEFTHEDSANFISGGEKELRARLSVEKLVTKDSVPAFLWHTFEDGLVPVENSLLLAEAYRRAGVPFELHIFEHGPHGLSVATFETADTPSGDLINEAVSAWTGALFKWLRARGFAVI